MISRAIELLKVQGVNCTEEMLVELGLSPKELPMLLHHIVAADENIDLQPLLKLSVNLIDPYYINPANGLTPIQVALNRRDRQGKRDWSQALAIATHPGLVHAHARTGYAILIAAKENNDQVVRDLQSHEALTDFSYRSEENDYSPQHWAVSNDNLEMLARFLTNDADADDKTRDQVTPFTLAMSATLRNNGMLACLCHYRADINDSVISAARAGQWDDVLRIITFGKRDNSNLASKLLFVAIKQQRPDKVKLLLQSGATFSYGNRPGLYAATKRAWSCFQAMLDFNITETLKHDCQAILAIAAGQEQWDIVKQILRALPKDARPNQGIYLGKSALQWLVIYNKIDLLRDALEAGCVIESISTSFTASPLLTALELRCTDSIKLLLEFNAPVEGILDHAVMSRKWHYFALILDHNKSCDFSYLINGLLYSIAKEGPPELLTDLVKREGLTIDKALKKAISLSDHAAIIKLLDAVPHYKNEQLLTPLLPTYIDRNQPKMVRRLLQHGASANAYIGGFQNLFSTKPAQYAAKSKKWACVEVFADHQDLDPVASELGGALLLASQAQQWELVTKISRRKPRFNFCQNGYCAGHNAILHNRIDVLMTMLDNGLANYSSDYTESLLDYAEICKRIRPANPNGEEAITVLEKYGANHHSNIIHAARSHDWSPVFERITLHYFTQPNRNETLEDLRVITGKLLHSAVRQQRLGPFISLLKYDADVTQIADESSNTLELITNRERWDFLEELLRSPLIFSRFSQSQIQAALITCLKKKAPFAIIGQLADQVKDIDNTIEADTGNTLLHLAVHSGNLQSVQLFAKVLTNKGRLNKAKKSALSLALTKDSLPSSVLDAMSMAITGSSEWVEARKFETQGETVTDKNVLGSRERSLARLEARYPNVNVNACLDEYRTFIRTLPRDPICVHEMKGNHHTADAKVAKSLALLWMAAKDESAFPGAELNTLQTRAAIDNYVKLRKTALAESHHDAKELSTCDRGTCTKIVAALNHAHPDVVITYTRSHIQAEAREIIMNKMRMEAPTLLSRSSTTLQRRFAHDFHINPEKIPTFMTYVSQKFKVDLKLQFGELMTEEELDKLLIPAHLAYIDFALPEPFVKLAALIEEVKDFIEKCENFSISSSDDMEHLSSAIAHAYDDNARTLREEYAFIKDIYDTCLDNRSGVTVYNRIRLFAHPQPQKSFFAKLSDKLEVADAYIASLLR